MNPCVTFSRVQMGVMACLLDGMTAKQSAQAMGRSINCVTKARERIYRKLGARTAHQVAAIVARTL